MKKKTFSPLLGIGTIIIAALFSNLFISTATAHEEDNYPARMISSSKCSDQAWFSNRSDGIRPSWQNWSWHKKINQISSYRGVDRYNIAIFSNSFRKNDNGPCFFRNISDSGFSRNNITFAYSRNLPGRSEGRDWNRDSDNGKDRDAGFRNISSSDNDRDRNCNNNENCDQNRNRNENCDCDNNNNDNNNRNCVYQNGFSGISWNWNGNSNRDCSCRYANVSQRRDSDNGKDRDAGFRNISSDNERNRNRNNEERDWNRDDNNDEENNNEERDWNRDDNKENCDRNSDDNNEDCDRNENNRDRNRNNEEDNNRDRDNNGKDRNDGRNMSWNFENGVWKWGYASDIGDKPLCYSTLMAYRLISDCNNDRGGRCGEEQNRDDYRDDRNRDRDSDKEDCDRDQGSDKEDCDRDRGSDNEDRYRDSDKERDRN